MNPTSDNAEERILEAAKKIFYTKGLGGARMQEIADEAGINKAMLHYYFRSKDKLFERVFMEALGKVIPHIAQTLGSDLPLEEKFTTITNYYHQLLLDNPMLPVFVFQTLQSNPDKLLDFLTREKGINPGVMMQFFSQLQHEIAEGNVAPIDPRQLLLNLISMSVFPFIMKPLFTKLVGMKEEEFEAFVKQRQQEIPGYMMKIIQPEQK